MHFLDAAEGPHQRWSVGLLKEDKVLWNQVTYRFNPFFYGFAEKEGTPSASGPRSVETAPVFVNSTSTDEVVRMICQNWVELLRAPN